MCRVSCPYCELSGQVTGLFVPSASCAEVQTPRPCAAEVEIVISCGKVMTTFFIGGVSMPCS